MKPLGAALLVLAGYLWGWQHTRRAARRSRACAQLQLLLRHIQNEIELRGTPLADIWAQEQTNPALELLRLARAAQPHDWALPPDFTPQERSIFAPFFLWLGHGTTQESVQELRFYRQKAEELEEKCREEERKANRLYRPFGICLGALAALAIL